MVERVTRDLGSREAALLMYRSAADDLEAFAELYDATSSRVYGLAVGILRSPSLAEQVAHESYLEVWRTAAHFDSDRCGAVAWILAITLRPGSASTGLLEPGSSQPPPHVPVGMLGHHVSFRRCYPREEADLLEALTWLDREQRATLQRGRRTADEAAPDHLAAIPCSDGSRQVGAWKRRSVDRFCDITKLGPGLGPHRCRLAVTVDVTWASLAGKAVPDPDDSD